MNPATILAHINAQPFRPFTLETVGGTSIDVTDRADIFVYQRMLPIRIVAFNPARGIMYILARSQSCGRHPPNDL